MPEDVEPEFNPLRVPHVEVFKGRSGKWSYRNMSGNGQTENLSETYFSKWNAKRAAKKQAHGRPLVVIE